MHPGVYPKPIVTQGLTSHKVKIAPSFRECCNNHSLGHNTKEISALPIAIGWGEINLYNSSLTCSPINAIYENFSMYCLKFLLDLCSSLLSIYLTYINFEWA